MLESLAQLASDDRGQTSMQKGAKRAIALVVSLVVTALVAAFLLPVGINEIVGVDTANWSSGAAAMWGILDVIIVLAVFLFVFGVALSATDGI